jgi:hypothetical protein
MAIALNLLAEQQLAEDLRRRDPVRRTIVGAGLLVALVLSGSLFLLLRSWLASEELASQELRWQSLQKENKQVIDELTLTAEIEQRLGALTSLASNRFLWASVFNALQDSIVPNIQLTRLKTEQKYLQVKPVITETKGKKAPLPETTTTETVTMTIEARDYAGQFSKFQEALATNAFFKSVLTNDGVKLVQLSPPSANDPESVGQRSFVVFTIECLFNPKTR